MHKLVEEDVLQSLYINIKDCYNTMNFYAELSNLDYIKINIQRIKKKRFFLKNISLMYDNLVNMIKTSRTRTTVKQYLLPEIMINTGIEV